MQVRFTFIIILTYLILFSCSTDENSPTEEIQEEVQDDFNSTSIELNITENQVIASTEISITISGKVDVSRLEILFDNESLQNFSVAPYSFTLDAKKFDDGDHILKIDVYGKSEKIASKTINVKIDNNGPILILEAISQNELICSELKLSPQISDVVSAVKGVKIYMDSLLLLEKENISDFTFALNPEILPTGNANLKFIMEDEQGNISRDSIDIAIAKKILDLNFPKDFMRKGVEKIHVVLSDNEGKFLDSRTHSSGEIENLEFCIFENIEEDTEFMLTFVHDFENSIFNFYVYSNLTKSMLGNEINLKQTSGGLSHASIKLEVPFYEDGYQMRASGPWQSINYYNGEFSGHVSTRFSNELATDKTFISYFNSDIEDSYQWAMIQNIQNRTALQPEDFNSTNVTKHTFDINRRFQRPLLKITGYENEAMYRARSGHLLYSDYLEGSSSFTREYTYADIFDYTSFWGQTANYTWEGSGIPPTTVTIPDATVDYSFYNGEISFTGLSGFEVGRIRLVGIQSGSGYITPENPSVRMEFIFDGQSTNISLPQIPEGLFPAAVTQTFDNKAFEIKQGAAENYSAFTTYSEYISNVLVPSVPFYVASPFKERIFKSEGPQWLPANEFPF